MSVAVSLSFQSFDPCTPSSTDRRKQTSSGFCPGSAPNVKQAAGVLASLRKGVWVWMRCYIWHWRKFSLPPGCLELNIKLWGDQLWNLAALNAWLKSTQTRTSGFHWTFQCVLVWKSLEHHLNGMRKKQVQNPSLDSVTVPSQLKVDGQQIFMCQQLRPLEKLEHLRLKPSPMARQPHMLTPWQHWTNRDRPLQ